MEPGAGGGQCLSYRSLQERRPVPGLQVPAGEEVGPAGFPNLIKEEEQEEDEEEKKEDNGNEQVMEGKGRYCIMEDSLMVEEGV